MPNGVSCSVANCSYWGQGNKCKADEIMIDVDSHAHVNFDAEFAEEHYISEHKDAAKESAGTCCHTFKPKE